MALRDKLNENPAITTAIAAGIILLALIFLGWSLLSGDGSVVTDGGADAYYTTDGRTIEEGDYFDLYAQPVGGNEKFRAQVFRWGDGGEPFVGWMERLSPAAREAFQAAQASGTGDPLMAMAPEDSMSGLFVARPPGDDGRVQWVPAASEQGQQIMQPPRRNGEQAIQVYP